MKIKIKYLLIFFLLFSFFYAKNSKYNNILYFKTNVQFGYDSNVLKYSESEPLDLNASSFIAFKPSLYTYLKILKRKTKITFSARAHHYFGVDEKSNYGYSLSLRQPIGNYQYFKFKYLYINDIYLRKYDDLDSYINYYQIYDGTDCYFNLSKITVTYESPYINKKDKFALSLFNETQYYNPSFTEYDLNIWGSELKIFTNDKNNRYSFIFGYSLADSLVSHNQNLLTEDYYGSSLRRADRSYKEFHLKLSYDLKLSNNIIGVSLSQKKREYLSQLNYNDSGFNFVDELHIDRKHRDFTFTLWSMFKNRHKKNKIILSYRQRMTSSPYQWVEDLKNFKKYNLEYIIYFDKVKIGK